MWRTAAVEYESEKSDACPMPVVALGSFAAALFCQHSLCIFTKKVVALRGTCLWSYILPVLLLPFGSSSMQICLIRFLYHSLKKGSLHELKIPWGIRGDRGEGMKLIHFSSFWIVLNFIFSLGMCIQQLSLLFHQRSDYLVAVQRSFLLVFTKP